MTRAFFTRLGAVCVVLFVTSLVWALLIAATGGFELHVASRQLLSARNTGNPLLVALVTGLLAWLLAGPDVSTGPAWLRTSRVASGVLDLAARVPSRFAPVAAAAAVIWVVAAGMERGAFVAGAADGYGYVSQAHLWAAGDVTMDQPFVRDMQWRDAPATLAPLGYRPVDHSTAIVPMFPPGLPLVMSLFERVAGRGAVFYVVPLLGGLAVWATYLLGVRVGGRMTGAISALLLATSPPFLFQLMLPMTDVPVTAWWALSLALVLSERRAAVFAAGLVAGLAILTRLNLAPVAIVPGVWLLWVFVGRRQSASAAAQRLVLYGAGLVPGCVAIAWINWSLYGSPLVSGLGDASPLYRWSYLLPNLATYPRWLVETETHVVLLALGVPVLLLMRARYAPPNALPAALKLLSFAAAVFASYAFFLPHDSWIWLRFLLPCFPAVLVLTALALEMLLAPLDRAARLAATALIVGLLAHHGIRYSLDVGVFNARTDERKTRAVGEYIATHMSERAVFVSMLHSGSIRLYSGRLTVRYDVMPQDELDRAIGDLRALGYHPYLVLEPGEEPLFKARFDGHSRISALDWEPVAEMSDGTAVRIYDPAEQGLPAAARAKPDSIR